MRFERRKRSAFGGTINLTSLIDVLCVLVIFFMLTTKYISYKAIELSLGAPDVQGEQSTRKDLPQKDKNVEVQVLRHKHIKVNGLEMPVNELSAYLKPRLLREPKQEITVKSSKGILVQDIVSAMDEVRLAGGTNFNIASGE